MVSAHAQSFVLDKGQSGFGITGSFSTNDDISGFTGGVGYSFSGVFDLGISVGRFGFDQQFFGEDLNATTISPYASYFVVKQDEQTPVSFAVNGSYERQMYSNDVLSDFDIDMTGSFFSIGASLYRMIEASETMNIQPAIGFSYITGEIKIEDSTESITESDNTTFFALGLSLIFRTSPTNTFVVTPTLGFGDDVTTFGLTLGLALPHNWAVIPVIFLNRVEQWKP